MQVSVRRIVFAALATAAASVLLAAMIGAPDPSEAAFVEGADGAQVLFGKDDDNPGNATIQPPGTAANQSLDNTDVFESGASNDVLIGLLGSDVMRGEGGRDILVGGTEQGAQPNSSDVMFGGPGNDTNVWAPGDGSDAFLGGTGLDALVFGVIDRGAPTTCRSCRIRLAASRTECQRRTLPAHPASAPWCASPRRTRWATTSWSGSSRVRPEICW